MYSKMYYEDNHIKIYNKDCRDMSELPDEAVQMVVTSPPYWGLRKYSGEQELIWGDNDCEHQWGAKQVTRRGHGGTKSTLVGPQTAELSKAVDNLDSTCVLCGAWKGAYGLEPTPEMYVEHTIEILRGIRRVLRKDGVVFWDIGDSYQGGNRGASLESDIRRGDQGGSFQPQNIGAKGIVSPSRLSHPTIKPKDLCLIPFRVAIAAQEDGWWIRSVIIWSKPNPMPESVTDRPTESHEYILMLTKSKKYYWDADAVREQQTGNAHSRGTEASNEEYQEARGSYKGFRSPVPNLPAGRNIRSVWNFPTQPFPQAHFAVFPEKLPEICIKAATPEVGCCSKCGAPWERVIEKTGHVNKRERAHVPNNTPTKTDSTGWAPVAMGTDNWQPTCKCNADKAQSIVLDPFSGAGTTLWVAKKLNRRAVGYEISDEYCQLAVERCQQQGLL